MIHSKRQINKGFTLVETLIAISIFSVSIVGLMSILGEGISGSGYAKNKIIAGYLAQEGIEYVRNMRDNYMLFSSSNPSLTWSAFVSKLSICGGVGSCGFDRSLYPPDIFICANHLPDRCELYINNGDYNTNSNGEDSGFNRTIQVMRNASYPDEIKIVSTVTWNKGQGGKIVFSESLFNWTE